MTRARAVPALAAAGVRPDRAALAAIGLLVTVAAFVATLVPPWLAASATTGLRAAITGAPPAARNLELALDGSVPAQPGDPLALVAGEGGRYRAELPPVVGSAVTADGFVADSIEHLVVNAPVPITQLRLRAQPGAGDRVTWVAGRAPAGPPRREPLPDRLDIDGVPYEANVYEVGISAATAELLRLEPGDRLLLQPQPDPASARGIGSRHLGYGMAEITGLFEVTDPADPAWFGDPALARPGIEVVSFDVYVYHVTALVTADSYPAIVGPQPGSSTVDPVFPVRYRWRMAIDGSRLDGADLDPMLVEVARLRAAFPFLAIGTDAPSLQTNLDGLAGGWAGQWSTARAILLVAAIGPVVATGGALALGGLLLARRRRASTAVVRSRGASTAQVAGSRLAEGLLLAVPAALLGGAAAVAVAGAAFGSAIVVRAADLLPALVVGLASAGLLLAAALPSARAAGRASEVERATLRPTQRAIVGDLLALAVAAAAGAALLGRGFRPAGGDGGGPDPLLAAAPALLALAAARLAVRILPIPVAVVARLLARRRDLVPVLAARSAARRPGESTIPLLVVIVATAAGVFSSVILASIGAGQQAATWLQTGADVRLEVAAGRSIPNPVLDAAPDGVRWRAEARVGPGTLRGDDIRPTRVTVVAIDAPAFATVLDGTPAWNRVPATLGGDWAPGMTGTAEQPVPMLVAPSMLDLTGMAPGTQVTVEGVPAGTVLAVAGSITSLPGFTISDRTVVIPLDAVRAVDPAVEILPTHLLVAAEPGAEAALADAYRELAEPYGTTIRVDARSDLAAGLQASTVATTLRAGFAASLAVALAFAALALLAGVVLAAAARASQLAILRTLGLGSRGVAGLVLLEQLPLVGAAVAVGIALGLGLAALLVPALGLRVFTGSAGTGLGGELAPVDVPLVVDPATTIAFAVVPVLVVVGVVTAAAWVLAHRNLARSIRMGEA